MSIFALHISSLTHHYSQLLKYYQYIFQCYSSNQSVNKPNLSALS